MAFNEIQHKVLIARISAYMRIFRIAGDWKEHAKALKEMFPLLTDTDLIYEANEKAMLIRLGSILNKDPEELKDIISNKNLQNEERVLNNSIYNTQKDCKLD